MGAAVGDWGGGTIRRVTRGHFPSNAYLVEAAVPGGCVLIDPGLDGPAIDAALTTHDLTPERVFCTHGHFDHAGSAAFFQKKYGCPVFLHRADARTLKTSNFLLMAFKIPQTIDLPDVTWVDDGATFDVAGAPLRYRPAPGHTPGSCVIELGAAWFTGDTLYSRGVGLSKLPGEDPAVLRASIRGLWAELTPERTIYPGHGEASDGASVRRENRALSRFLDEGAS